MFWDVITVEVVSPLTLTVCFADGLRGDVVFSPNHLTGVFSALQDPNFFKQACVQAVTWPGEIDLAPDAMHSAIKQSGVWHLNQPNRLQHLRTLIRC
jgi:Protein of unknown function (DUF2442)